MPAAPLISIPVCSPTAVNRSPEVGNEDAREARAIPKASLGARYLHWIHGVLVTRLLPHGTSLALQLSHFFLAPFFSHDLDFISDNELANGLII